VFGSLLYVFVCRSLYPRVLFGSKYDIVSFGIDEGLTLAVGGRIIAVVRSRSGARVRLTEKQWEHIVAARPELGGFRREVLEAVEHPDEVYEPPPRVRPQLHAVKRFERLADVGLSRNLVVVYRELARQEGFIITAFPISDRRKRRMYRLWRRL